MKGEGGKKYTHPPSNPAYARTENALKCADFSNSISTRRWQNHAASTNAGWHLTYRRQCAACHQLGNCCRWERALTIARPRNVAPALSSLLSDATESQAEILRPPTATSQRWSVYQRLLTVTGTLTGAYQDLPVVGWLEAWHRDNSWLGLAGIVVRLCNCWGRHDQTNELSAPEHMSYICTPCLKKTVQNWFCQNFVKFPPILITTALCNNLEHLRLTR